ncbi:hypothetical protein J6590_083009, partial [Homalodisca vitripennis]
FEPALSLWPKVLSHSVIGSPLFDGSQRKRALRGVKTEYVLHGFTYAQYDRKRIVHNTVASPVEHGRRGCPGAETFW